ncbi:MAG: glycosyltransferase family 1 protein [Proteobacteria bacterium]|nr:glycosyltransferase family 1 protein [Pseudomonadota bacterium]MBU1738850.1 glycosyltransferase family 1 protein [Pseudomonadota bacterium]
MRIAIITDAWHPQVSGVVTTLNQTIHFLKSWGNQLLVVTPEDFRTVPCPSYPEISLALFPRKKLNRLMDEFSPEVVHIATEGPLGWSARRYCLQRDIGFTTSYHTRFPEYVRLRFPVPLAFSYKVVRRFHRPAKRTMVVSNSLKAELENHGFSNIALWSRGVDTNIFKPRGKEFIKATRPIAMFTGRVAVEKNIEAFLKLNLPGTKYVVGDGPARRELMERYPEVCFPGFKHGSELAKYMAAADVFVFPSRTDTFGVVMLEANACGLPIAAFPVTGPLQIVKGGVNGVLDEDLESAVLQALGVHPEGCLAEAGRYSWEASTRQFLENCYRNHDPAQRKKLDAAPRLS